MVKFGKYFRQNQNPAYAEHYFNYKSLKQFIRSQTNPKPSPPSPDIESQTTQEKLNKPALLKQFIDLLDKELKKVYMFFVSTERDLYVQINQRLHRYPVYYNLSANEISQELDELNKVITTNLNLSKFLRDNLVALSKIIKKFDKKFKHFNTTISFDYPIEKLEMKNSDLLYMFQFKIVDEVAVLVTKLKNELLLSYDLLSKHPGDHPQATTELQEGSSTGNNELIGSDQQQSAITVPKTEIDKKGNDIQQILNTIETHCLDILTFRERWNMNIKKREFSSRHQTSLDIEGNTSTSTQKSYTISKANKWNVGLTVVQKFYMAACTMFLIPINFSTLNYDFDPGNVTSINENYGPIRYFSSLVLAMTPLGGIFSLLVTKFWITKSYKKPMIFSSIVCLIGNVLYVIGVHEDSIVVMCVSRFIIGFGLNTRVQRNYILDFIPKRQISWYLLYFKICSLFGNAIGPLITFVFAIISPNTRQDTNWFFSVYVLPPWIFSLGALILLIILIMFYSEPVNSNFNPYGEGQSPEEAGLRGDAISLDGAFIKKDRKTLLEINDKLNQCNEENQFNDTNLVARNINDIISDQRSPNGVVAKAMCLILLIIFFCNFIISSFTLNIPMFIHDLVYQKEIESFKDIAYDIFTSNVNYGKESNYIVSLSYFVILAVFTLLYWINYYYISTKIERKKYMLILAILFFFAEAAAFLKYTNYIVFLSVFGLIYLFGNLLEDQVIYFYTKTVPSDFIFLFFNSSTFVLFIKYFGMFLGFIIGLIGFICDKNLYIQYTQGIRDEFNIVIGIQIALILIGIIYLFINMNNFKECAIRRIMRHKDFQQIKRTEF